MKVWHVNLAPGLGSVDGILSASAHLAQGQARVGHDARLFLLRSDASAAVASWLPPELLDVSPDADAALLRMAERVRLADTRPDVVHLHGVFRPLHARLAWRLRRAGVPFVTSPHSGLSTPSLARYRWRKLVYGELVERHLLRAAAGVACLTATEVDDVRAYARRPDLVTWAVPNGLGSSAFDITRVAPVSRPDAGWRPTVITLARYDVRQKGLDRLAVMAGRCPEVDFVVYGEMDKNEQDEARRLIAGAPANLRFAPPVRDRAKRHVLASATMFIQPSRWEGLSVALAEALAAGLPCAVSSYVGDSLGIGSGDLGLVLDDDPVAAADQLRSALDDPERLEHWSRAGRSFAVENFDADEVARRQLAAYAAACASATPAPLVPATAAD